MFEAGILLPLHLPHFYASNKAWSAHLFLKVQGPFFSSTHTCVSVYTYECRRARQSINPMTAVVVGSASVYGAASFTTSWTPSPTLYSRAENIATELPGCAVRCLRQQCASFDNACLCVVETKSIIDRCVLGVCGMPEAIFTRNLTETTCQTPVRRKTSDFNPLVLGITPITVLIVFFRLVYNQFFSPRTRFNLEELALIAASGVGIVTLALQIFGVNGHGMGTDVWGLDRSTLYTFRRYFYMIQIGYIVLMLFLKLTVTFFYFNIFFGQRIRTVLWATVIFHVAALTACALAILIQCLPIEYQWDKFYHIHDDSMTGQCININTACWVNSSISVASDLWLLAVPLSQLRKLKLHWKKKLGASLMFIAGFSVTVISVLRLSSIGTYASTTNPTWDQWDILWWSFIEIHVGLVCTCLPAMRLILIRLAPQIFDSKSSKIHTISLNRVSSLGTQLTHLTQFTQLGGDEEAALPKPSPAPAATLLSTAATAPEPILYNHYNSSSNAGESLAAVESPERWHDEVPLRKAKKPDNWRNSVP